MEKRNTFSVRFYLKKNRATIEGEIPVYLRITINGQRADMSMHVAVLKSNWNSIFHHIWKAKISIFQS